jgi:hypothetical protein
MPEQKIATREDWQAARDELAKLEAEHAQLSQKCLWNSIGRSPSTGRLSTSIDLPHSAIVPWRSSGSLTSFS